MVVAAVVATSVMRACPVPFTSSLVLDVCLEGLLVGSNFLHHDSFVDLTPFFFVDFAISCNGRLVAGDS